MEVKIKTLYSDRIKPTDLLKVNDEDVLKAKREILDVLEEAVDKIMDDSDNMVGIYISRE